MNNQNSIATEIEPIRELTTGELDIVAGGVNAQGDLKGALAKLEKEIKSRE